MTPSRQYYDEPARFAAKMDKPGEHGVFMILGERGVEQARVAPDEFLRC